MLLWLKLGGALGFRHVAPGDFRWSYVVVAVALGALLGLLGQAVWGVAGPLVARALGAQSKGSDLRLVWGGSSLPQVVAMILLLPLDLTIAGQATFTDARFSDSLSAAWASLSIALATALALWSLGLFVLGTQVATGMSLARVVLMTLVAGLCLAAVCGAILAIALAAGGS
jgi:hypothetical protein